MVGASRRPRIERATNAAGVTALVGHAGAGKTVALRAAVTAHRGPYLHLTAATLDRADLRDQLPHVHARARHSAATTEPSLLAIDDVDQVAAADTTTLLELIDTWTEPHQLLLAGRRLPPGLPRAIERRGGRIVDATELQFDDDELYAVLGSEVTERLQRAEPELLAEGCARWPAVLERVAQQLHTALGSDTATWNELITQLITARRPLREQVDQLLDAAPSAGVRRAVIGLASLPGFDDAICRRLGLADGVDEVRDLGWPLEAVAPGLAAFWGSVAGLLGSTSVVDPGLAHDTAEHYLAQGYLEAALQVLLQSGTAQDLATALADLRPGSIGRVDPARHAAAVGALPAEVVAKQPRTLLHLADGFVLTGQPEEYRATIDRARQLIEEFPHTAPQDEVLEVMAADLTMRAVVGEGGAVLEEARALLARPALPPMARARLLGGLGRATAHAGTALGLRRGARQLARSAQLFRQLGADVHAAASLTVAATYANWPLGRYQLALDQLDLALRLTRDHPRARIAALPYRAFILIDLGRYPEAETVLAELRRTAHVAGVVGNDRAAAFARWGAARMASQRGDATRTWAACQAVARSGAIMDTGDAGSFHADAAQLLARVGRSEEARGFLDQARQLTRASSTEVELAAVAVSAYAGDRERVVAGLEVLEEHGTVPPRDRWRVTLLHAYVCHLDGRDEAPQLAAAAFEEAAQLGHPYLPMIREPEVAHTLLRLGSSHSASARELTHDTDTRICLLGGLSVEQGATSSTPVGRPGELIALLAVHGRAMSVERAIGALWPDGDLRRGRERLRTVLHRVRRTCGELIERRGDTVHLRDGIRVDVEEFRQLVRRARSSDSAVPAAAAAIDAHTGELVPAFATRSWVVVVQQALEQELLEMYTLLATAAEAEGDLDGAIRVAEAATAIDDTAEHHHLAIARLLAEQGQYRRALQRLADTRQRLLARGLEPSEQLGRLEAYLRRSRDGA